MGINNKMLIGLCWYPPKYLCPTYILNNCIWDLLSQFCFRMPLKSVLYVASKYQSSQTVRTSHLNSIQNPTQITFTKYIRIVTHLGSFLISFTYLGKGNLPGTHSYLQPISPQISDKKLWRFFRRPSNTNQNCVLKWGSNT